MRTKTSFITCVSVLCVCLSAASEAQTIVDPARRIDWSQAGTTGGIPNRTTICATLSPGATASQINSAIANCASGQVVKLNAGTYNLSSGIDFNGKTVTLRGTGPDQTLLVFSSGSGCIGLWADVCVRGADSKSSDNPGTVANWTAGFAKGTTSMTLSTTTGLSVGMMLVLDQLDDSDTDNGNIWICQHLNVCATEGGAAGRPARAQMQFVKVTAISGTTVTFTPGLQMPNWRSSQSPQAWWVTPITGAGIEDLSMNHLGSGTGVQSGVFFGNSYNCWVKNVRSLNANRNHIWLYEAAHVTVRDSYFYGTLNSASQSYGVESRMSSDNLVENNIFQHITAPMMTGNATGSVFAYNYSIDDFYNVAGWMQASSYLHDAGVGMILFEGNDGPGLTGDAIHGTQHFVTAFRNVWVGWETGKSAQTSPVILYAFNRFMNLVGNVLGKPGYHNQYEDAAPSGSNANGSIYVLGWSGNGATASGVSNDTLVRNTLMRWGNYDAMTNTSRFVSTEVPSGLSQYSNPVPSGQTLPASFYLSVKPSWWGSAPWPAIGPDITGGQDPTGHAYKIPAHVCYDNTPKTSGVLNFNAANCYVVGAVAAPTNLRIIR